MTRKILLSLVVPIALDVVGVLGAALTKPDTLSVARRPAMAVPPVAVNQPVADFKAWDRWSPWARLDPTMKSDFGDAAGLPGATCHWTGSDQVGEARMTITEVAPPSRLAITLAFITRVAAARGEDPGDPPPPSSGACASGNRPAPWDGEADGLAGLLGVGTRWRGHAGSANRPRQSPAGGAVEAVTARSEAAC